MGLFGKKKDYIELAEDFNPSKKVGVLGSGQLIVDYNSKQWTIKKLMGGSKQIYRFSDIVDFELVEDGHVTVTRQGVGKALAGGLMFGDVGAIVGGMTAKEKTSETIHTLHVRIKINNRNNPMETIKLIDGKTKTGGLIYKQYYAVAQDLLAELEQMSREVSQSSSDAQYQEQNYQQPVANYQTPSSNTFVVDQLKELRALHESGAITDEEYEMAKAKILG